MTFTPIRREPKALPEPFLSTPPNSVRLASYRPYQGSRRVMIFWLGLKVSDALCLTQKREPVSLMVDRGGPVTLIGIKRDANGDFRASRRSSAVAVHLDMATTEALIGQDGHVWGKIPDADIQIIDGMLIFPLLIRSSFA